MIERAKGTSLEWIAPVIKLDRSARRNTGSTNQKVIQKDATHAVLEAIGQAESYEETMSRCLDAIDEHTEFDSVALLKLDEAGNYFDLIGSVGFSADAIASAKRLPFDESLSGQAVTTGEILSTLDLKGDTRVNPNVKKAMLLQGRTTLVSIPLILRKKAIGVMNIAWNAGRPLDDEEKEHLMFFGYGIAVIMEAALHEHRAKYDQLMGLYNRREFEQQLKVLEALSDRYDSPLSVLVIDIDHFKEVNDRRGHSVGDETLRKFGDLIRCSLRATDLAFRIGGEEVVILMPGTPIAGTEPVAERILKKLRSTPMQDKENQEEFYITASIGVAELRNRESGADTLHRADSAMYQSKENGRNQYTLT
ncbi:MAG: sensor domain-containing diguanylate cyclase [Agarilytica sp.]